MSLANCTFLFHSLRGSIWYVFIPVKMFVSNQYEVEKSQFVELSERYRNERAPTVRPFQGRVSQSVFHIALRIPALPTRWLCTTRHIGILLPWACIISRSLVGK